MYPVDMLVLHKNILINTPLLASIINSVEKEIEFLKVGKEILLVCLPLYRSLVATLNIQCWTLVNILLYR